MTSRGVSPLEHLCAFLQTAGPRPTAARRGAAQQPITWLLDPESFSPMAKLVADQQLSIVTESAGMRRIARFAGPGSMRTSKLGCTTIASVIMSPRLDSIISQDPLGLAGGQALYGYVRDPLAWVDERVARCSTLSGDPATFEVK
ncbi:MAG: hypothetical protein RL701_6379 [Pseudomonadota bacterium]|jgi:hypothetical protein